MSLRYVEKAVPDAAPDLLIPGTSIGDSMVGQELDPDYGTPGLVRQRLAARRVVASWIKGRYRTVQG